MAANNYFYAIGRRKSATARVRLKGGKGEMTINGKPAAEYFADSQNLAHELQKPFIALEEENKFDITALVQGGGHSAQAEAVQLGIAKALTVLNPDLKSTLRRAELLSRDSREKERKKYGLRGARKKQQFSKR